DLTEAGADLRQALRIQEKMGAVDASVATLGFLGVVSSRRGELASAEAYARQAASIVERAHPSSLDLARSLNVLANVLRIRGDLKTSEKYCWRAIAIERKLAPDGPEMASSLTVLARDRGDWAHAQAYARRALSIARRGNFGVQRVVDFLEFLGFLANAQGNRAAAEEY